MAIQRIINGILSDTWCFYPDGGRGLAIVGQNGAKLNQPGTRGLVIKESVPSSFKLRKNSSGRMVVYNNLSGYTSVTYDDVHDTIFKDFSGDILHLWSMENRIKATSISNNQVWLFPCLNQQGGAGIVDSSRYGDKPIQTNNFYYGNQENTRGLRVEQTSYKTEFYVQVWSNNNNGTSKLSDFIKSVYVPYVVTNYECLALHCVKEVSINQNNKKQIGIWALEFTTDIHPVSQFAAPIFLIQYPGSPENLDEINVSFAYCFKDD